VVCQPARVLHQHNLLARTGASRTGKGGEFCLKEGTLDTRSQMEDGTPRDRMHKADHIAPGEAMLHDRQWTLPNRRPHPQHGPTYVQCDAHPWPMASL
jgi:hypothetical protein